MIYGVDHIVCAVRVAETEDLAERLLANGFRSTPLDLDFPEIAAASTSYATASGAYVELVVETEPGAAPAVWFAGAPRMIGVGFSSDDFDRDVATWDESEGMWRMDKVQHLPDGSSFRIHAAGPHPHFEPFYVFVMDTPVLPYADLGAEARLTGITFSGVDASAWRNRLTRWLGLEQRVGDVALTFEQTDEPGIAARPAFEGPATTRFELF